MKTLATRSNKLSAQCARRCFSSTHSRQASEARIVEVGPRDGLQNEPRGLELATKVELIRRLSKTGVRSIEAGSCVSPKWVPQMANSTEVLTSLLDEPPPAPASIAYNFLVPNQRGLENFIKASKASSKDGSAPPGNSHTPPITPTFPRSEPKAEEPGTITSTSDPDKMASACNPSSGSSPSPSKVSSPAHTLDISIFLAATESFSRANTNCTIAESLDRAKSIHVLAKEHTLRVRAYISVALGCPYDGPDVPPQRVAELTRSLLEMGCDEVSVADTTGMGTAPKTLNLLKALFAAGVSPHDLALHFHDTYGQALVNVCVGLEHGIRVFDSAVGGLGGCPYSRGATGNVSTEDLVHCLHSLGVETGVDLEEMSRIGDWISREMGRPDESRVGKAVLARLKSA